MAVYFITAVYLSADFRFQSVSFKKCFIIIGHRLQEFINRIFFVGIVYSVNISVIRKYLCIFLQIVCRKADCSIRHGKSENFRHGGCFIFVQFIAISVFFKGYAFYSGYFLLKMITAVSVINAHCRTADFFHCICNNISVVFITEHIINFKFIGIKQH